jgi:hypothetical protein
MSASLVGHARRVAAVAAVALLLCAAGIALASQRTISRSGAPAIATAVNLRHGDLPTLKVESNTVTAQDKRSEAQMEACIGEAPSSEMFADVVSSDFVGPSPASLTISSETQILPSTALVAKDLAADLKPHALTCVEAGLSAALRRSVPKGATLTLSAARLPTTVSGTDGVVAVRVTVVVHVKQGSTTVNVPVYLDSIGFAYGQAEVSLNVTSTNALPSTSLEHELTVVLVSRAHAAIG